MKAKRIILGCVAILLLAGLAVTGYFGIKGYRLYSEALENKPLVELVQQIQQEPEYTKLEDMPEMYIEAVLATEDKRFYTHSGIDIMAILRALMYDLKAMKFVQGGSTITQQFAKNQFFTQEKLIERKIAEVFMAFELEKQLSKDEILELYLNTIFFGEGYTGIGAACQGYFGKPAAQMTDYECVLLAGVPNAPTAYSLTKNPELAVQRAKQVTEQMVEQQVLSPQQANDIMAGAEFAMAA